MAKMLPSRFDTSTSSAAERKIFDLLKNDPNTNDWIVLHSLGLSRRSNKPYGEIDFVVLIPKLGVFCLEVKGGRIACSEGRWETTNRYGNTEILNRSPFLQAREGMFSLRNLISARIPITFPTNIIFGYAVVMPDISFNERSTEWEQWQIIDHDTLQQPISAALFRLANEQRKLHRNSSPTEPTNATLRILQQLLRPDFELIVTRSTRIEETEAQLLRLTEEQFEALDLLVDNDRCFFEGAAGTGKTMLAWEYAQRSSAQGRKTLFICYNRLLGEWLECQKAEFVHSKNITVGAFFKLLRDVIVHSPIAKEFREVESKGQSSELYEISYPDFGRLAVEERNEPYDVLVVDEAQDLLRGGVLEVLNVWLKGGIKEGCWAIFGDFHRQAIFSSLTANELKAGLNTYLPQYTKGRISLNCRNSRNIGEETALLSGFNSPPYRMGQIQGVPVDYRYYNSNDEQVEVLAKVINQFLSEGVPAEDIVVISRLRLQNSGVAEALKSPTFRLIEATEAMPERSRIPIIRFATVHAFKGMESPVVLLCDVDQVSESGQQSLLYVAMSRARSQLTVFVNEKTRPLVAECVRRKLQEGWNKNP